MKRFLFFMFAIVLIFSSCDTGTNTPVPADPSVAVDQENQVPAGTKMAPTEEEIAAYPRLSAFDSSVVWWLRKPTKSRDVIYNIAEGDPIAAYCTDPGWAYIFYDDQAVIGYEPFPDRVDVMQNAVKITVELHNRDYPSKEWGYINVAPTYTTTETSNDPVLDVWQYALCTDDGTIVDGPYTAEFDFNWAAFKSGGAALQLESWNQQYAPIVSHIVWGPDA